MIFFFFKKDNWNLTKIIIGKGFVGTMQATASNRDTEANCAQKQERLGPEDLLQLVGRQPLGAEIPVSAFKSLEFH